MEKPFYISQLPEKTQAWIKEKTKENFLKDGMSEEEAEQKATDFLDEKVNVAEEFFGKDFYKSLDPTNDKLDHEIVNDFSIDAIKDNFTPPGAKGEDESNPQAEVRYKTPEDLMIPTMSDEDLANSIDGIERGQSDLTDAEKPIALGWIKDEMKKRKSAIDTNDNGKIEVDEMADFQKSLDDYAAKNKKGRDDIPVTTRR